MAVIESEQVAGRRERNKARTREALRAAACRLFAEQGFAATTVEEIADAADVSERTFFRYFDSKEDLLLPDLAAFFASIERELRARPAEEHPLDAYLAALLAVIDEQAPTGGITTIAPGLDPTDATVVAHLARSFVNWEARLTTVLADRARHTEVDDAALTLHSAVVANIAVATTRGAMRAIRSGSDEMPETRLSVLRDAFAIARSGCPLPVAALPHNPPISGCRWAGEGSAEGPSRSDA